MPCLFSRDMEYISRVMHLYETQNKNTSSTPRNNYAINTILYPSDFLPTSHQGQMAAIDSFVNDLEKSLDIKRTNISISKSWKETHPKAANSDDLHSWLDKVLPTSSQTFMQC